MADSTTTDSLLQTQIRRAVDRFEGGLFRSARRGWDQLVNREMPVDKREDIKSVAEGVDYQTPDLKKMVRDWISVNKMNPAIFDVISTDNSVEAKKKLRQVLHWLGRGWEYENEGRVWDRNLAQGQVQHGLMIARYMYREAYVPTVEKSLEPDEYLKERNRQLKKQRYPFYWSYPSIFSSAWIGDADSEEGSPFFVYESIVPYIEARADYKKDGKVLSIDRLGKVAWLDRDDDPENHPDANKMSVKVTVVDKIDLDDPRMCPCAGCDHKMRKICVYVSDENETASEKDYTEEYESPFPGCSFFVVGGDIRDERDPHLQYPPAMYESFVEAEITNFLTVELIAQMLEDNGPNRYYLDYGRSDPAFFNTEKGVQLEYDFGRVTEGKIQAFPGTVQRMPSSISPHLIELLRVHRERLANYSINRFLLGNASTEASNATASAYTAAQQQAGLMPSMLLGEGDRAIMKSRRYALHAIRYWGMKEPEGLKTPYTVPLSGNDSMVKYLRETPAPGEVATIDADLLEELDFDIIVRTKAETLAEEERNFYLAEKKYAAGVISFEQFLRASGTDDIEGQLELLDLEKIRKNFEPHQAMLDNAEIIRIFEAGTGISTGMNAQTAPPTQPSQGQGGPPLGASPNSGRVPNLAQAESPGSSSTPMMRGP